MPVRRLWARAPRQNGRLGAVPAAPCMSHATGQSVRLAAVVVNETGEEHQIKQPAEKGILAGIVDSPVRLFDALEKVFQGVNRTRHFVENSDLLIRRVLRGRDFDDVV